MSSLEDNISTIPCGTPTGTSCGTPTGTSCGTPTGTPGGTPSKRIKRFCKYRTEWQADHVWVSPVLGNIYKANCTMCHRVFSISHGGRSDLRQHAAGNYHIRTMQELSKQGVGIDHFMLPHNFSSEEADMGVEDLKSSVDLSMGGNYHVRAMQGQKMPGGMDQFMIPQTYTEADMIEDIQPKDEYSDQDNDRQYNYRQDNDDIYYVNREPEISLSSTPSPGSSRARRLNPSSLGMIRPGLNRRNKLNKDELEAMAMPLAEPFVSPSPPNRLDDLDLFGKLVTAKLRKINNVTGRLKICDQIHVLLIQAELSQEEETENGC